MTGPQKLISLVVAKIVVIAAVVIVVLKSKGLI